MKYLMLVVITTFLISSCKGKNQLGDQPGQNTEQPSEQQQGNNNPETPSAPEKSLADRRIEYEIEQQQKNDPGVSFGKEKGWKGIYEIANPLQEVANSDMHNYDKQLSSGEFQFSNEHSRLRIKTGGIDFSLVVILSKKNNSGSFEEIKRYSLSQESSSDFDLDILNGIYHIEVKYNSVQTAFRLVWEKEEQGN